MNFIRKWVMFPFHVIRIWRTVLCMWLLEKLTHEEHLPLMIFGRFVAHEGDVTVIKYADGKMETGVVANRSLRLEGPTVNIRVFRRHNGK